MLLGACCCALQEHYDADDLLFFLHVRSVVQKELGMNFRSHWSELGRDKQSRAASYLSHRDCQLVSRVVFGSETDPLFKAFMNVVERHVVGQRRGKSDTRRIEVMQFLHLALSEYHAMSPADNSNRGGPGGAAAGADSGGAGGAASAASGAAGGIGAAGPAPVISSREQQDRLFREAVAGYDESLRTTARPGGGDAEDVARESRVKAMEATMRSQLAADGVRPVVCVMHRATVPLLMLCHPSLHMAHALLLVRLDSLFCLFVVWCWCWCWCCC